MEKKQKKNYLITQSYQARFRKTSKEKGKQNLFLIVFEKLIFSRKIKRHLRDSVCEKMFC